MNEHGDYAAAVRADFERREQIRAEQFQRALDSVAAPVGDRTPEEVAALRERLRRLEERSEYEAELIDLDEVGQ